MVPTIMKTHRGKPKRCCSRKALGQNENSSAVRLNSENLNTLYVDSAEFGSTKRRKKTNLSSGPQKVHAQLHTNSRSIHSSNIASNQRIRKGHWSRSEDAHLLTLIDRHRPHLDWNAISKQIPGRNAKQCRERWLLNLDPSINRGPWTAEEDAKLVLLVKELGGRWSVIAKDIPGRTENSVKTRYQSIKRKFDRNREWTTGEDEIILNSVLENGREYRVIEKKLNGRTRAQIKRRFDFLAQGRPDIMLRVYKVESQLTDDDNEIEKPVAESSQNLNIGSRLRGKTTQEKSFSNPRFYAPDSVGSEANTIGLKQENLPAPEIETVCHLHQAQETFELLSDDELWQLSLSEMAEQLAGNDNRDVDGPYNLQRQNSSMYILSHLIPENFDQRDMGLFSSSFGSNGPLENQGPKAILNEKFKTAENFWQDSNKGVLDDLLFDLLELNKQTILSA